MTSSETTAYTDGACRGNPGPGGWAWAIPGGAWASGYEARSTNQRMEISAALEATRAIDGPLRIVSDSTYVVNCWRDEWWKGWIARGWKNSQKKPVANQDLWEPLVEMFAGRADLRFEWVKGHSDDPMNDLVDRLAVAASWRERGDSGDVPPRDDQLGPPDNPGATVKVLGGSAADSRVPEGWRLAVVGVRTESLGSSDVGRRLRSRLAQILAAQRELHPELVVMTGLRQGTEMIGAGAAGDAGLPYIAVLPYPDPVAGWPVSERGGFDDAVAAATSVVTLERKRPTDLEGRRKALSRRDGWLRRNSHAAIVVLDDDDPESDLVRHRFIEAIGDDVWDLDISTV
ncbi:MAG: ribonuclease H [Acidimicrobiales bacterium]